MSAQSARRRMLRMALVLAVTLGIAAQSLVAVVGEIHELSGHSLQAAHGHASHHVAHEQESAAERGGHADTEGSLHVLLHHSHCAHCAWMAGAPAPQLIFVPALAGMPPERASRVPAFTPSTPFRPPIPA